MHHIAKLTETLYLFTVILEMTKVLLQGFLWQKKLDTNLKQGWQSHKSATQTMK